MAHPCRKSNSFVETTRKNSLKSVSQGKKPSRKMDKVQFFYYKVNFFIQMVIFSIVIM